MELVFEARLPGGEVIAVFEDGTATGLPDGAITINHFTRRYALCAALLKKSVDAGLIADHEAAGLLAGRGGARAPSIANGQ